MKAKTINRLLIVVLAIFLLSSIAGADLITKQLSTQATQLTNAKAKSLALDQEQAQLIAAKKEIAKYSSLEQIAQSVVPQDKDQAQTVREIVALAQASGITLSSVTFPSSSLGTPGIASTTPSQVTAVKGIPGIYVLPIQVAVNGSGSPVTYNQFYQFLTSLEHNRRTSQVNGLTIQPLNNGVIDFSLTINEYIKPR